MQLTVSLTPKEAEVFFTMLSMSTNEPSDVDFKEFSAIERKFRDAKNKDATTDKFVN